MIEQRQGKTILAHSYHQAPLKVAKPFIQGNRLQICLMDASPGLFNGDTQEIECTLKEGTHLFLTNQSSCKLHPSSITEESKQIHCFTVHKGALLEYFPEPIVPYTGSLHRGEMMVSMHIGGEAMIGEILTPGRIGRSEQFHYTALSTQLSVYWEGKWVVWDSLCLEPQMWKTMTGIFDEYTHLGTLWFLSERVSKEHQQMLEEELQKTPAIYAGVSLLPANGLVVRMLGISVWELQHVMGQCRERMEKASNMRGTIQVI